MAMTDKTKLRQIIVAKGGEHACDWGDEIEFIEVALRSYRDSPINALLAGRHDPPSAEVWVAYFSAAQRIVLSRSNPEISDYAWQDKRIQILDGCINRRGQESELHSDASGFDVIINNYENADDGIQNFRKYFSCLEQSGIYLARCQPAATPPISEPNRVSLQLIRNLANGLLHETDDQVAGIEGELDDAGLTSIHDVNCFGSTISVRRTGATKQVADVRHAYSEGPTSAISVGEQMAVDQADTVSPDNIDPCNLDLVARAARNRELFLEGQLASARQEFAELQHQTQSSRWLVRRLSSQLTSLPGDFGLRVHTSLRKRWHLFKKWQSADYRSYCSASAMLRYHESLPVKFVEGLVQKRNQAAAREVKSANYQRMIGSLPATDHDFFEPDLSEIEQFRPQARIVVLLHLYYADLWQEVQEYLMNIEQAYDLVVSLVRGESEHLRRRIIDFRSDALIVDFPNRGRDIAPFVTFLNAGVIGRYEFLLKIHAKKTSWNEGRGIQQRHMLLDGLIGSPEQVCSILASMNSDATVGLVTADQAVYSADTPGASMKKNAMMLAALEERITVPVRAKSLRFAAGSMFWARPHVFTPLVGKIELKDFEQEPIPNDGTLAHALERYFGAVAIAGGNQVMSVNDLEFPSPYQDTSTPRAGFAKDTRIEIVRCGSCFAGERTLIYASHAANGSIKTHSLDFCRSMKNRGFKVVFVIATDLEGLKIEDPGDAICDAFLVRQNKGFHFASWAHALSVASSLWLSESITFANDEIFGPFRTFDQLLERIDLCNADFVGLTESLEVQRHFQSSYFVLKKNALQSNLVRRFWYAVKALENKRHVFAAYELQLLNVMQRAELACEALYSADERVRAGKPTRECWRQLLMEGFPFVEVELLRDNPFGIDISDWVSLLSSHGADIESIISHLRSCGQETAGLSYYRD